MSPLPRRRTNRVACGHLELGRCRAPIRMRWSILAVRWPSRSSLPGSSGRHMPWPELGAAGLHRRPYQLGCSLLGQALIDEIDEVWHESWSSNPDRALCVVRLATREGKNHMLCTFRVWLVVALPARVLTWLPSSLLTSPGTRRGSCVDACRCCLSTGEESWVVGWARCGLLVVPL